MIIFLPKLAIRVYQYTISPLTTMLFGRACRHHPTCSQYTYQAIDKYGFRKGLVLGIKRIFHCTPFGAAGFDPA